MRTWRKFSGRFSGTVPSCIAVTGASAWCGYHAAQCFVLFAYMCKCNAAEQHQQRKVSVLLSQYVALRSLRGLVGSAVEVL
jgi:hypothetical protein